MTLQHLLLDPRWSVWTYPVHDLRLLIQIAGPVRGRTLYLALVIPLACQPDQDGAGVGKSLVAINKGGNLPSRINF